MWIKRDFLDNLDHSRLLEAIFIRGPRQIGKSSILAQLVPPAKSFLYMDDLNIQQQAQNDPIFLLEHSAVPVLIDEAHLAPPLFFEIKKRIDASRRERLIGHRGLEPASYRLTGSNQFLIDSTVKETLAGRVNIFYLLGLSIAELKKFDQQVELNEILFRGGFPELWVRKELSPIAYLNDYISTFIEKDLAVTSGIEKRREFLNILRLCAARVGELLNYESLSNDSGVSGPTVKSWISLLEANQILGILNPYFTNLNKRLIKMPKVYFLDVGICSRLQSHQEMSSILMSPHAGHLFECLVYGEIIKTKQNFSLEYDVFFWRTKDQEEIDFVIESPDSFTLIEVKLGSSVSKSFKTPGTLKKIKSTIRKCIVTAAGVAHRIDSETDCVPVWDLSNYLRK